MRSTKSYAHIVRSATILGGAQGITLLFSMVRTKGVAVLIGPEGVGDVGLLTASVGILSVIFGLGIGVTGVKEITDAVAAREPRKLAETVVLLRRICWITGLCGWAVVAAASAYLSLMTFETTERSTSIALLGSTILLGNLVNSHTALLQGTHRIGDLAQQSIAGAVLSTLISIGLYYHFRAAGIVPVLLTTAFCNLWVAWLFTRRIPIETATLTTAETMARFRRFVGSGVSVMSTSISAATALWVIQMTIFRHFGSEGNGVYNAAWALSAQFAGFIMSAMYNDYYPRLAGARNNHDLMNAMVNEQTEIGILMALPGLMATLAFSPWLVQLFYSSDFARAADLLPWLVLGVFGRIIGWPLGYVMFVNGSALTYAVFEFFHGLIQITLVYVAAQSGSLEVVAIAFPIVQVIYIVAIRVIAKMLTGFSWSPVAFRLFGISLIPVIAAIPAFRFLPRTYSTGFTTALACVSSVMCIRSLKHRLGPEHRLSRLVSRCAWLFG